MGALCAHLGEEELKSLLMKVREQPGVSSLQEKQDVPKSRFCHYGFLQPGAPGSMYMCIVAVTIFPPCHPYIWSSTVLHDG